MVENGARGSAVLVEMVARRLDSGGDIRVGTKAVAEPVELLPWREPRFKGAAADESARFVPDLSHSCH